MNGKFVTIFGLVLVAFILGSGMNISNDAQKPSLDAGAIATEEGGGPGEENARSTTNKTQLFLPSETEFANPPMEYRIKPIYTGEVDKSVLDHYESLEVGGLVINSWDWNQTLLDYADSKGFDIWANDYYMYPSGNANPNGGVNEKLWNPSFEISRLGMWPDGWQWSYYNWPIYDETGANAHSGTDAIACDTMNSFFWPTAVDQGSTYNFTCWAKGAPGTSWGRMIVMWQNYTQMLGFSFHIFPVTTGYQSFSFEAVPPVGATSARLVIQGHEDGKFVWFDDIMIRNVTTPQTNELVNPGFEIDAAPADGTPDGWWTNGAPVYDTTGANSRSGTDACLVNASNQLLQLLPAVPGESYYMGEWIKGQSGGEVFQLAFVFVDSDFKAVDVGYFFHLATTSYQYLELERIAPEGSVWLIPVITTVLDADFVWVDDVMINISSPLTPGVSRGPVLDGHPELEAQGLYYNFEDVTAPGNTNFTVPYGKVESAVACPLLGDGSLDLSGSVDISSHISNGLLNWTPASGTWRAMVFVIDILYNGTEVDPAITNMHQINVMNPTAVQSFIDVMYDDIIMDGTQPHFADMVSASFTDEVSNLAAYFLKDEKYPVVAWLDDPVNGHRITTEFTNLHGYDVVPVLPALFNDCGSLTGKYRMDFYNTTGWLQGEAYYRMIGEWCDSRGFNFSGHLLSEENLVYQVAFYGDFWESIKHMGIPGMDTLIHAAGELDKDVITPKLVSSAAELYGRDHSMTEYSVQAAHMNYRNMTGVVNWEAVQGIDIVTSFSYWVGVVPDPDLRNHSLHIGRTNYMLDQGDYTCDIAVYYPTENFQAQYIPRTDVIWDRGKFGGFLHDESFTALTGELLAQQLDFLYINEESLERTTIDNSTSEVVLHHGISGQDFRVLIVPEMHGIGNSSLQKIKAFYDAGGVVISVGDLPYITDDLGEDPYVKNLVWSMWDNTSGGSSYTKQTSANGGQAIWARGDLQQVIYAVNDTLGPDLFMSDGNDDHIYYRKNTADGFHVYYIVNNRVTDSVHNYWLRGRGEPSLWNPETGAVTDVAPSDWYYNEMEGYTIIKGLDITGFSSVFVVMKRPVISLEVTDIWFDPAVPLVGTTATIFANVTNIGFSDADNLRVGCYLGPECATGVQIGSTKIITLAPDENQTVVFTWDTTGYAGNNNMIILAELPPAESWEAEKHVYVNSPPTPVIWSDKDTVYTYEEFNLSGNQSTDPDGPIQGGYWDFGDGNGTGSIQEPAHYYTDDGDYTVTMYILDSHGVNRSATKVITVLNRAPLVDVWFSPPNGSVNTKFRVDAANCTDMDGVIEDYEWNTGDFRKLYGQTIHWTYDEIGIYNCSLTVTDDDGEKAVFDFDLVVENLAPTAGFSVEPAVGNVTTEFTFVSNSTDPDGLIAEYFWDFGDGTNSSKAGPKHSYSDDTTYTVTLKVRDGKGEWSEEASRDIVIENLPPSGWISFPETIHEDTEVTFLAMDVNDPDDELDELSFDWSAEGTNKVGVERNFTTEFSEPGEYNVTLGITDDDEAKFTFTQRITVFEVVADDDDKNDTDSDGLPDAWEIEHFGDLDEDGAGDYDNDGYTNLQEYTSATDPTDPTDPPAAGDDDDDDDTGLGAGLVAGIIIAVVIILIVICAVVFFIIRSKKPADDADGEEDGEEADGDDGSEDAPPGPVDRDDDEDKIEAPPDYEPPEILPPPGSEDEPELEEDGLPGEGEGELEEDGLASPMEDADGLRAKDLDALPPAEDELQDLEELDELDDEMEFD